MNRREAAALLSELLDAITTDKYALYYVGVTSRRDEVQAALALAIVNLDESGDVPAGDFMGKET